MKNIIIAVSIGIVLILGFSLFMYNMSTDNQEMEIRESFQSQMKVNKDAHDVMWKTIKQQAQVTDKYATVFSEKILPALASGRKDNGGLFRMITEQNPNFSDEMFKKLMESIAVERRKFSQSQKRSIDLRDKWIKLVQRQPRSWFIDSEIKNIISRTDYRIDNNDTFSASVRAIFTYDPVTSAKTKEVFETGEDNDVDLF